MLIDVKLVYILQIIETFPDGNMKIILNQGQIKNILF